MINIKCTIILSQLDSAEFLDKLDTILDQGQTIMALLDKLTADVAAIGDVVDSTITLLNGLKVKLDACGNDPVKLAELSAQLETHKNNLADAVAANTPIDPMV